MRDLPESEVYEQEFAYMPWGILIEEVLGVVQNVVPEGGHGLDLMCGPGYLLGQIAERRPDLRLEGVDMDAGFIDHAQAKYPRISFTAADVLTWRSDKHYDLVTCTGGIHHLPYELQEQFLERIPDLLSPGGYAIFADPYVDHFQNETERKIAAAKLGYEYMIATISKGAPESIVKATVDILYNDVMRFEFKTSQQKLLPVFQRLFEEVEVHKTWPSAESEYGDYYIVCRKNVSG